VRFPEARAGNVRFDLDTVERPVARKDDMPREIHERDEVRALIERGAQVVEVLGPEEFEEDHLPGAINLPLRKLEREARTGLDPARPVLVYCWDSA
jgi:rhodanese-related sulfurtransferase